MDLPPPRDRHRRGGSLPVMPEVEEEARRREVKLVVVPTAQAIDALNKGMKDTNAVLHLTC